MGGKTKRAAPRPPKAPRRATARRGASAVSDPAAARPPNNDAALQEFRAALEIERGRTDDLRRDLDHERDRGDIFRRQLDWACAGVNATIVAGVILHDPKAPGQFIINRVAIERPRSPWRIAAGVAGALVVMISCAFIGAWLFVETL